MDVDGYSYEIKDWELCRGLKVAPLNEVPIYIIAQIPVELADSFSACTFTMGFADKFTNKWYTDVADCTYAYTFTYQR